jgi:precorrin-6Y C5,15-methyltransferase (decarboxylating)
MVIEAEAPGCLDGLAAPDAVFIGGGVTATGLLERCWHGLAAGGRLVANAVTLDGERTLLDWHQRHGGDLTRLAISRVDRLGSQLAWRPALPVIQLAATKS